MVVDRRNHGTGVRVRGVLKRRRLVCACERWSFGRFIYKHGTLECLQAQVVGRFISTAYWKVYKRLVIGVFMSAGIRALVIGVFYERRSFGRFISTVYWNAYKRKPLLCL